LKSYGSVLEENERGPTLQKISERVLNKMMALMMMMRMNSFAHFFEWMLIVVVGDHGIDGNELSPVGSEMMEWMLIIG
jgi:hypothetical protein